MYWQQEALHQKSKHPLYSVVIQFCQDRISLELHEAILLLLYSNCPALLQGPLVVIPANLVL